MASQIQRIRIASAYGHLSGERVKVFSVPVYATLPSNVHKRPIKIRTQTAYKRTYTMAYKCTYTKGLLMSTHHNKYMPFQIDQLPSSGSFPVKNFTFHWSYFIHFLSQFQYCNFSKLFKKCQTPNCQKETCITFRERKLLTERSPINFVECTYTNGLQLYIFKRPINVRTQRPINVRTQKTY